LRIAEFRKAEMDKNGLKKKPFRGVSILKVRHKSEKKLTTPFIDNTSAIAT
jgi:hypothetical protein